MRLRRKIKTEQRERVQKEKERPEGARERERERLEQENKERERDRKREIPEKNFSGDKQGGRAGMRTNRPSDESAMGVPVDCLLQVGLQCLHDLFKNESSLFT